MSIGSFILGVILMATGFYMVRKTDVFIQTFGDFGEALGIYNAKWASWKMLGVAFLVLGFLITFGLLQLFFWVTIGQLFFLGQQ